VIGSDKSIAAVPNFCFSPYPHGGRTVPGPTVPQASYQELIAEHGKQKLYELLGGAMKIMGACPIFKNDFPAGWSGERKAALIVVESALPIKTVMTDASRECDSVLSPKGCSLLIDYTIENVTEIPNIHSIVT
jgi:hypothetical protein